MSQFPLHLGEYYESDKKNLKNITFRYLFKKLIIMRLSNPCTTCKNLVCTSPKALGAKRINHFSKEKVWQVCI